MDESTAESEGHEPWLAVNLASFVAGLGQFYLGWNGAGFAWMVAHLALWGGAIFEMFRPHGHTVVAVALWVAGVGVQIASAIDAYRRARRTNPAELEEERRQARDAWRAVFFSRVFPGLGHLVNGRPGPGIAWIIAAVVLAVVLVSSTWIGIGYGIVLIAAGAHAYLTAGRRTDASVLPALGVMLATALVALVPDILRAHVVQATRVPSRSMEPAIQAGDCLYVRKYGLGSPARGEIWAFRVPGKPHEAMLKRVIALPGETIEIRDKRVWVNGAALDEPYAVHRRPDVLQAGEGPRDNLRPYRVPADYYFTLGDNRDDSNDSRFFGPVSRYDFGGRASKIYWPLARQGPVR